ncbi:MAG: hypothetical protein VKO44_08515, partial [Cyanobacteriota bacterium]|nr:hypothetical protein [Cyanobacteriota bacterium]
MGLAAFGFIRILLLLQTPAAADLPESLRGPRLRLEADRWQPTTVLPPRREQDVAWGPSHRYHVLPPHGRALRLELVVRRSRDWKGMALSVPAGASILELSPHQQVLVGTIEGRPGLRTCVVGRGLGELQPRALVEPNATVLAVERWRDRLDGTTTPAERLWRGLAIQAGLRVSERWE